MKPKILIFIITYKASYRVYDLYKGIPFNFLKKYNYSIYASDDASNDDTIKYLLKIKKNLGKKFILNVNKFNLGYGGNIKKCLKFAYKNKFDYVVMLHGDNQYNPKYIYNMIKLFLNNEKLVAVVGSRMTNKLDALKGGMPIYKFIGNFVLTTFFNILFKTNFKDCHSGMWAYNINEISYKLFKKADNNFCFDIDTRLMLTSYNKKIKEITIKTFYGDERSSFHIIYALRFLFKIFKFKLMRSI